MATARNLRPVVLVIVGLVGVVIVSFGVNLIAIPGISSNVVTKAASTTLQGIGMAVLIAALVPGIERWVTAKAGGTPYADILDNETRCQALSQALGNSGSSVVMTTRYSRRTVGQTAKSMAFLHALKSRLSMSKAETYRIVSLDNPAKLEHVRNLLTEYHDNPKVALAVVRPEQVQGWPDLFVVADHLACVGVETPDPNENYWIRIQEPGLVRRLEEMYRNRHWASATVLKRPNEMLDPQARLEARARLDEMAAECGIHTRDGEGAQPDLAMDSDLAAGPFSPL